MAVEYLERASVDDPISAYLAFQKRLFIFFRGVLYDYDKHPVIEAVAGEGNKGYIKIYRKDKYGRYVIKKDKIVEQKLKGTVKIVVLD